MINVIYEDQDVIVVAKPPGMPSQKDKSGDEDVYTWVGNYTGSKHVGLIQRLDRPVGGLMVLTLSQKASIKMTENMKRQEIEKHYLAIVDGKSKKKDTLDNYIRKVRGNRAVVANKKVNDYKHAVLHYYSMADKMVKEEKSSEEIPYSLLDVKLETGRFHQIRAQLAHHKMPLVGDTKYNSRFANMKGWHSIGLYAYKLSFFHPINNQPMNFVAPYVDGPFSNFAELIKSLEVDPIGES